MNATRVKGKFETFIKQKWVRIIAPVLAGVLLLGIGGSIGYEIADEFDRDDHRSGMSHIGFGSGHAEQGERPGWQGDGTHSPNGRHDIDDRDQLNSDTLDSQTREQIRKDTSADLGEPSGGGESIDTQQDMTPQSTPDADTKTPANPTA